MPGPDPPEALKSRLRWRCRRGMKELDLLLEGWLRQRFDGASGAERGQFAALLDLPDPTLAGYLLAREPPAGAEVAALVAQIRGPGGQTPMG